MAAEWHIMRQDKQYGPFTDDKLHELVATKKLLPNDLVWKQGMPQWITAGTIPSLFSARVTQVSLSPLPSAETDSGPTPFIQIDAGSSGASARGSRSQVSRGGKNPKNYLPWTLGGVAVLILVPVGFLALNRMAGTGGAGFSIVESRSIKDLPSSLHGTWRQIELTGYQPKDIRGRSIQAVREGWKGEDDWVGDVKSHKIIEEDEALTMYFDSKADPKSLVLVWPSGNTESKYWIPASNNNKTGRIGLKVWGQSAGREPPSKAGIWKFHLSRDRKTLEWINDYSDGMFKHKWISGNTLPE
jgi:hypothetical protein